MRWFLAASFCLLTGCVHSAYTLARQGRTQVLTPPPVKPEIRHARSHPAHKNGCDIEGDSFSLTWRGNTAKVAAKTESYFVTPPKSGQQSQASGVTITESGPRIYMDPLAELESFRQAVTAREDKGCLKGDEAAQLEQSIAETFAFPPQIAAYLRFGTYTQTGFIDLTPGLVLRLVRLAGTNTDFSIYAVTRVEHSDRVRIMPVVGGGLSGTEKPAYYRYLYRTGASSHNFLATILGATDRDALHEATNLFTADPEGYCAKPAAGVSCRSLNAGVNAGFNVRINGTEVFVRLGGSLGEAIGETRAGLRTIGPRAPLPQVKSFRRSFHGKMIPVKFEGNEIFSLVMMPGDEVVTLLQ